MPENPYKSPEATTPETASPALSRSLGCTVMSWLTGLGGGCLLLAASWNAYASYRHFTQNTMGVPPYVVVACGLIFGCGIGLLYSSRRWSQRRVKSAILSLAISGAALFLGPLLLAELLA